MSHTAEDTRQKLVRLLQLAYSGEKAAALAYQGHAASVKDPAEAATPSLQDRPWGTANDAAGGAGARGAVAHVVPPAAVAPSGPEELPSIELRRRVVHSVKPHLPPSVLAAHRGEELQVDVTVCVHPWGEVDRARTHITAALPGTEEAVLDAVYATRYEPQPVPFCGPVTYQFHVR